MVRHLVMTGAFLLLAFLSISTALEKDWGRSEYAHCVQPYSWRELVNGYKNGSGPFKAGGLGRLLEDGGYETWQCLRDHYCAVDPDDLWMCFVYHETDKVFTPWGENSRLKLIQIKGKDCPACQNQTCSVEFSNGLRDDGLVMVVGRTPDDHISVQNSATLNLNQKSFSWAFWVKRKRTDTYDECARMFIRLKTNFFILDTGQTIISHSHSITMIRILRSHILTKIFGFIGLEPLSMERIAGKCIVMAWRWREILQHQHMRTVATSG